jgi:preprotein translocase subunit SecG
MVTALYILHVIVCLAMLPIILLQAGKGGGVSAVFGGGSSGNVFGSRGASTFLTRMTTGAAIVFMCTSMGLAYVSSHSASVIDKVEPPVTESVGADESAPAEAGLDPKGSAAGGVELEAEGGEGSGIQIEVEEPPAGGAAGGQKD